MNRKKKHQKNNEKKTKILIVDDHSIVRKGLMQLINEEPDLVVCAEAKNATQALEVIEKKHVDLAIVDISLDGTNGIQLTAEIKSQRPDLPVLILTIHDEALYAKRAFQAGAKGYITKQEAAETIITAIRLMLSGKDYVCDPMAQKFLKEVHSTRYHC